MNPDDENEMKPSTILAVDDDLTTLMLICESLRQEGFVVHEATNGSEGLEVYRACDPDLVLLDVVMPMMNGFELCGAIRKLPQGERVPILMATGLDDEDSIRQAYEAGATDFITKPLHWALLGHRVRYMLRSGHTHEKLRRTMDRNRALLDAIPDAMIRYTPDGRILESKFSAQTSFPSTDECLTSRSMAEVVSKDYEDRAIQAAREALGSHGTEVFEFSCAEKESTREYEARVVVSGEHEVLAIIRDITMRKEMEQQLRASETRFRSLIENASDLITLVQMDGIILYESPAISRMLGYEAEALVGTDIFSLIYEDDADLMQSVMESARNNPGPTCVAEQVRMQDANGSVRFMEVICTLFDAEANEPMIVINSRDVTERLETQKALKSSEEQLRQSQKMEAIGRLAGVVAHDFNNLLTAILGYGQLLEDRLLEEGSDVEEAQEIRKAAVRATSLTRQLLTFSRKQVVQAKALNLNEIVNDIEKMLHRLMGEDMELLTSVDSNLKQVKVDPGQIEQVLLNLSVNARDAMPGGGSLTIETLNFQANEAFVASHPTVQEGQYAMLAVSDTGSGMSEETKSQVFEPFFTTKAEGKGTGLGLATVYGIVNQSDGHIWIDSEEGMGTTVNILFPVVEEEAPKREEPVKTEKNLHGCETVLVVEDENWVRALVKKCLERYGYTVIMAEDGEHALDVVAEFKERIDLMLTDVVMPKMGGVDLTEAMASRRPDMRVIFMSGYTDHAMVKSSVIDLERDFLQKPFTVKGVAEKIRNALD